jgi:hypothetical protein
MRTNMKISNKSLSTVIGDPINLGRMSHLDAARYVKMRILETKLSRNGEEDTYSLTGIAWQTALHIAVAYGWEPHGTVNHQFADWDGSYLFDYNQNVTYQDAINLAGALSKSVRDNFRKLRGTDLEFVSKKRKGSATFLKRLVSYIKRGSFDIGGPPDAEVPDEFCVVLKMVSPDAEDPDEVCLVLNMVSPDVSETVH